MIVRAQNHIEHRILLLITRMEDEKKVDKVLGQLKLPIYYQCRGMGTANSEILNICGLRGTKRLITISVLPHSVAKDVFCIMSGNLFLERKGGGIAVTIPVTGIQDIIRKILEERGEYMFSGGAKGDSMRPNKNKETEYSMILVAANYGYSDEIINAAHKAGAKGGTVVKGRRRGSESVMQFLGVTVQEEQEFILIVVPGHQKSRVMVEISRNCGLKTSAHGVVLSIPVEDVLGIEE